MRIIVILFMLFVSSTFAFGESLEIAKAQVSAIKVLNLVFLGAKVVGAIVIILGIVELLVEKEQGGQGTKKVSGAMKLGGGVLLLLSASVILWLIGDVDGNSGTNLVQKINWKIISLKFLKIKFQKIQSKNFRRYSITGTRVFGFRLFFGVFRGLHLNTSQPFRVECATNRKKKRKKTLKNIFIIVYLLYKKVSYFFI